MIKTDLSVEQKAVVIPNKATSSMVEIKLKLIKDFGNR
jgi:hypothetical protein